MRRPMRKYTFALSVTVHLAAAVALFIAPLFATESLPAIHEATEWVPVRAVAMPDPSPPSRAASKPADTTPVRASVIPTQFPLVAPEGVKAEPDGPPPDPAWPTGGVGGIGDSVGPGGGRGYVPAPPPP